MHSACRESEPLGYFERGNQSKEEPVVLDIQKIKTHSRSTNRGALPEAALHDPPAIKGMHNTHVDSQLSH